jgi:hypothetical protein
MMYNRHIEISKGMGNVVRCVVIELPLISGANELKRWIAGK